MNFKSFSNKLVLTVKYFLTPKEILILFFLLFVTFISSLFLLQNLTNYFKVDRIVYTGQLNEGVIGYPQITNPYQSLNQAEKNLASLTFSSLIKNIRIENNELKYDLQLADKIETDSNFSQIKITLRDNLKFSNSEEITTADIIHTLQNLPIEKTWDEEIIDDKNLVIKLRNNKNIPSYSDKIEMLEILTFPVISKQENFSGAFSLSLVTSGAYKINKIEKDVEGNIKHIQLKRYNNGQSKLPYLKYYNFYYYNDETSALTDLQTKEINLLSGVTGTIVSKIKDDESLKIISSKLSNNFALFLNQNKNEVLREQKFRDALSQAIDREALVRNTLGGYAVPEGNILGENKKTVVGQNLESSVKYSNQKISITTVNNKELVDTANFIANSWKKLGVEVEIKTIDRSELQTVVRDRDFDALLFGFSVKDVSDYEHYFHSRERSFPKLNIANYSSKTADKLLEELNSESDLVKREQLFTELSKVLETDLPVILLYKPLFLQAVTGKINLIIPDTLSKEEEKYKLIEHWFTQTEKVLPWIETVSRIKNVVRQMDLWVN